MMEEQLPVLCLPPPLSEEGKTILLPADATVSFRESGIRVC
jgi:hypothetical protein